MHPSVTASTPAACPICGMALVEMVARPRADLAPRPSAPGDVARAEAGDIETVRARQSSLEVDAPARVTADGAVEAVLYRDELLALVPGELARFTPAGGAPLGATLTSLNN
jgi:hypothetical protein